MPQIYVNPEKLKAFSQELKNFTSFIESIGVMTNSQLYLLRESWRDEQYDRFKEQFDKTMKLLQSFSETALKESLFLEKKAKDLEDYMKHKSF